MEEATVRTRTYALIVIRGRVSLEPEGRDYATAPASADSFVKTGIKGVDELLEGRGIPQGYIVFVLGGPGSGKTTFALQFLHNGAKVYDEPGVYVSLDEDPKHVLANARALGMDLDKLVKAKKLAIVDAAPIRFLPSEVDLGFVKLGKPQFALASLIEVVTKNIESVGAKRLVVDPLATFILQYPNEPDRRTAILDLMQGVAKTQATTLFVNELSHSGLDRTYQFEEYLAHGLILLRKLLRPGGVLRVFSIDKMRGVDHDPQPHPYKITKEGIEVYPSEMAL